MSWERPRFERAPRPDQEPPQTRQGHRLNPLIIIGVSLFAVAAFYVLLIVATMADDIFFPGNEFKIGINIPGVDSGADPDSIDIPDRTAARTDSVFVLTIDPYSKTAGVFSIPRDLLVEIPDGSGGYYTDRVNVVWETGEFVYDNYDGGGAGLIKDTIKHNFEIPIDNLVILDFEDFVKLVDEVGGIEGDVPGYVAEYDYTERNQCPRTA